MTKGPWPSGAVEVSTPSPCRTGAAHRVKGEKDTRKIGRKHWKSWLTIVNICIYIYTCVCKVYIPLFKSQLYLPTSLEDVRHQRIFAGTREQLGVQALQQVIQLHGGRRDPSKVIQIFFENISIEFIYCILHIFNIYIYVQYIFADI